MGEPPQGTERTRQVWYATALVVACSFLTYARGIPNALVTTWDDGAFIVENPDVHEVSLRSLVRVFSEVREESFQPLHWLSYWVDVPWFGASAPVLHGVNVAWWCFDLALVLRLMLALGLSLHAATFATLLFGLHPIQVEVVSWATGRKDIVATMFGVSCLLMYLRDTSKSRAASRVLYLGACLSKTVTLPLPAVMVLIDVLLRKRSLRAALKAQLPNFFIAGALGALTVWIWSDEQMIRPTLGGNPVWGLFVRVSATLAHYLGTFLWPARLSPHYPLIEHTGAQPWMALGAIGVASAAGFLWKRRDRELGFALGAFLVLLAPVSNVIPLYLQWQDRYLSQPLLALSFGAGVLLHRALEVRSRAFVLAPAGLALAALAGRTIQYQEAWSSDRRLWEHAVGTQPEAFFAVMKLGEWHRDQGQLDAAVALYERAIRLSPNTKLAHAALFYALALRDEARAGIAPSRGLEIGARYHQLADDPVGLRSLAGELAGLGYREVVLRALDRALDLEPVPAEKLEAAAVLQRSRGNIWLAEYYQRRARMGASLTE